MTTCVLLDNLILWALRPTYFSFLFALVFNWRWKTKIRLCIY